MFVDDLFTFVYYNKGNEDYWFIVKIIFIITKLYFYIYMHKCISVSKESKKSRISIRIFLFYTLIGATILFLLLKLNVEIGLNNNLNINYFILNERDCFKEIKSSFSVGWFNLSGFEKYEKWTDYDYLFVQYAIVPTILEYFGYNKIIICYYTSPIQLYAFCKKNKKYRLVSKDILTNYALLERKD